MAIATTTLDSSSLRPHMRLLVLASLGGALDYFDFAVYGIFARYIAGAFFPTTDPTVSILLVFLVYAVGYFARPLGAFILSHFGDKYGRRGVFIFGLSVMSVATLCIGLVPTYQQWGIAASVTLVILRILQGLSVGGEIPGAMAYVVETMPKRACFLSGIVQAFVVLGIVLATTLNYFIQHNLSPEQVAEFGWRIPFIVGGVLGFVAFLMRRSLEETPEFSRMKDAPAKFPVAELLSKYSLPLLVGIGVSAGTVAFNAVLFALLPVYLTNILKYNAVDVAGALNIALLFYAGGLLIVGWLGDRIPREWIVRLGAALLLILAFPFFSMLVDHRGSLALWLSLAALAGSLLAGIFACVLADLFPTRVRYTGSALGTNLSSAVLGGFGPLLSTWLISVTGSPSAPAAYVVGLCAIALVASLWLPRYAGQILKPSLGA